ALLKEHGKDFIIIGNTNALTYKETFKLIKDDEMRTGYTNFNVGMYFIVPDYWEKYHKIENGHKFVRVSTSCWFTSLEVKKHKEYITLYKNYSPDEYPLYDNYNAINVDKYSDIPCDYDGCMGVPVTFLDKYNPEQFEILGFTHRNDPYNLKIKIYTKDDGENFNDLNGSPIIKDGDNTRFIYMRVIIRRIGATQ
ncbi:MAG: adenine-specific methyltransferase EcoRI family protein, partial [Oscillospiraceae bacterium]|nr:adenine-specific methyltransferase EcoRI family protein [Oscillospiraceae bacterium]